MGAGFQIQDDILNLVAAEKEYGKEINGDIWEGKRTLMLIHLLTQSTELERQRLRKFLATPRAQRQAREVSWVRKRMDSYGSIDHARHCAHSLALAALDEFQVAYGDAPDSPQKRLINKIVLYMIERDF
jgi:geranylgeranyl diphosphate synthase type II